MGVRKHRLKLSPALIALLAAQRLYPLKSSRTSLMAVPPFADSVSDTAAIGTFGERAQKPRRGPVVMFALARSHSRGVSAVLVVSIAVRLVKACCIKSLTLHNSCPARDKFSNVAEKAKPRSLQRLGQT